MFKLRFPHTKIDYWAARYSYPGEEHLLDVVGPAACKRGHLTRVEFLSLCHWKSPRTRPRCEANATSLIVEATRVSLATDQEELKMGVLQVLSGVSWPTASVILHFCASRDYPILDYRALWSLSVKSPLSYTFSFWWSYVEFTRGLAAELDRPMRTVDRALWQYSKERQR